MVNNPRKQSVIKQAPEARWVYTSVCGSWVKVWLQADYPTGHWVQFTPGGDFHLVDSVEEIKKIDGE